MSNSQTEPVLGSSSETSPGNQKKTKVKLVCRSCGSDDIVSDAYARWDVQTQEWDLSSVLDNKICESCGYEKSYCDEVPVEEEEDEVTPEQRINDLLSANNRLVEDRRKAANQLRKNRDQFLFYAEQHRAKTTATRPIPMSPKEIEDTLNKALVNESFAAEITAILETISPR